MGGESLNYQQHLFFIERERNRTVPYWFLEETTRDEAEETLRRSKGNVLMRKHSSFYKTPKYVITYLKDSSKFRHYVVLNSPDGYLLDIDHENNRPVNCLSEVVDLFIQLTGFGAQAISRGQGSSSSYDERPSNSQRSYVNYPNASPTIDLSASCGKETNKAVSHHSYINLPTVSNSSQSKKTNHDYVNTQRTNAHSYINTEVYDKN